jgi:hypothetical protein
MTDNYKPRMNNNERLPTMNSALSAMTDNYKPRMNNNERLPTMNSALSAMTGNHKPSKNNNERLPTMNSALSAMTGNDIKRSNKEIDTGNRRTDNEEESKEIPGPASQNKNCLFGPAFSSDNAGDGPKDKDNNPPLPPETVNVPAGQKATHSLNRQATARELLTSHTPCKTTKISNNNGSSMDTLSETDIQDASDLCAEIDQIFATFTPTAKKTTAASTHNTIMEKEGTESGGASYNESNLASNSGATPPTTRQATAREALSCFGIQPLPTYTPCTNDLLRLTLEKAGILHSLEASGYFGDRTSKDYNGRWMDSLVEYHVQKEARDKLEQLIPEKLGLIQSMIELNEPQSKNKGRDCYEWICIKWNLDQVDIQKLKKIKDNLCGQKIPLDKLIKRHNLTATDKNDDQPLNKEMPSQPEASVNTKLKSIKNLKRNERRRKTKLPKDTPCDRPVRSTQFWDQMFKAPNRPPQPDPRMELEEASALLNDQYDEEEFTIEEAWTYLQIRRTADELMAKERRHRTAKTYIRIQESFHQSGKPHLPPTHKHTTYHAHIISHHPPTPPHNPTLPIKSLTAHYKGFSPHQQGALLNEDALTPRSLHTTVLFLPQTLQPARITPRGREDGPKRAQNEHPTPTTTPPNSNPKPPYCHILAAIKKFCVCCVLFLFIRRRLALALCRTTRFVTCGPSEK